MGIFTAAAPRAAMTYQRRLDRSADELLGLCRGMLADGHLDSVEARFLGEWLQRHAEFADRFPFDVLLARLTDALADGVLDADEELNLLEAISSLVGGERDSAGSHSLATHLPLNDPPPAILFPDQTFVVTGTFAFGPRAAVIEQLQKRGALVKSSITQSTRFLVIGAVGSRDWIHSSYGRKIEQAIEFRSQGLPVAIVSEDHWQSQLR